jgi:hypothetical protein
LLPHLSYESGGSQGLRGPLLTAAASARTRRNADNGDVPLGHSFFFHMSGFRDATAARKDNLSSASGLAQIHKML